MSARGPWKLEGYSAGDSRGWIVTIPDQQARIDISEWSQDSEQIARLIAAAPDLLAEIKAALRAHVEDQCDGCDSSCPLGEAWRAIIAKVEGR